jgi:hypothetical protein
MKLILKIFSVFFFILSSSILRAQELNCSVQVNSDQIQTSDKKVFETLQTSIFEFMNNRRWTNDQYLNQERIECSILINITERISSDQFKATIQIQSRRPVYKASYNTPIFNFLDNDFEFRYVEFQPLEFNETQFTTNLTSVLAYYAYVVIGMDYDSFSLEGGSPYFQKAQLVVNNAQSSSEKGWKAYENVRNRYWITENLLNPSFRPLRAAYYKYHRQGFDLMTENKDNARAAITESIEMLRKVQADKPGSVLMQLFFVAKSEEIVSVYTQAFPDEKNKVVNALNQIDPANANKYAEILKSN